MTDKFVMVPDALPPNHPRLPWMDEGEADAAYEWALSAAPPAALGPQTAQGEG